MLRLSDLCIHPKEQKALDSLAASMPHALLLVADSGFGKSILARALADKLTGGKQYLQLFIEPLPESKSITIDQARSIKSFFRLKASDSAENRVVIIDKAELLTTEAQNSLLKVLEEPPASCHIILNTSRPGLLLQTIRSRVTIHNLIPPTKDQLTTYLKSKGYKADEISQALALGSTLPGLVLSILSQQNTEAVNAVQTAKELLGSPMIDRLKSIDKLAKDKIGLYTIIESIKMLSETMIINSVATNKPTAKWATILRASNDAVVQLDKNASPKLVLTNFFLSI